MVMMLTADSLHNILPLLLFTYLCLVFMCWILNKSTLGIWLQTFKAVIVIIRNFAFNLIFFFCPLAKYLLLLWWMIKMINALCFWTWMVTCSFLIVNLSFLDVAFDKKIVDIAYGYNFKLCKMTSITFVKSKPDCTIWSNKT